MEFRLFGPAHLAILALCAAGCWAFSRVCHRTGARGAFALAGVLNELAWYAHRYSTEGVRYPEGLPLQLCDLMVWLAALACWRLNQWVFEAVYFAGVAGAAMALLTPALWAPLASYPSAYYFAAHAFIVIAPVGPLIAGLVRPREGCLRRVFLFLNAYAACVGVFNWATGANYMYLCRKPAQATALDWFGPWPVYIVVGEAAAFALFWLLWSPFGRR